LHAEVGVWCMVWELLMKKAFVQSFVSQWSLITLRDVARHVLRRHSQARVLRGFVQFQVVCSASGNATLCVFAMILVHVRLLNRLLFAVNRFTNAYTQTDELVLTRIDFTISRNSISVHNRLITRSKFISSKIGRRSP
jgi:hypothetical protein